MYSWFALMFKASYWRMLFRAETWRGAWLNLRRAHKDRRARKQLRSLAMLCLAPVLCLVYLAWVLRGSPFIVVPILVPIFVWQWFRSKQRQEEANRLRKQNEAHDELTEEESRLFRQYFAEVALIYAVMLDRAGSERYLRDKELPEGVEVTTRRVHLELLKSRGLWDKMAQRDREAMMMPDGGWNNEWIEYLIMGFEPLRLLRWLLRIDFYLPVIGRQMRFDYKMANEIVRAPQKLLEAKEIASASMMETGKKAAEQFYNRCMAEQIYRGYVEARDEHSSEVAVRIATDYADKQHEDLVLGVKLVSEVSREELEWATMLSRRRVGFLHWTMIALDNGMPPGVPYKFQP
jgi:hypothetical protein